MAFLSAVSFGSDPPSISELRLKAEAGDAKAQFELGRVYADGKDIQQDETTAVEWFHKAADQGYPQAQNSLGVMYALGRGVPRDKEAAVGWYKKAAKQGLVEGIYNAAISYYNGEGIATDFVAAAAWMMAAERQGDAQARESLQHINDELNNRIDGAKFRLAGLYEKGDELPQDLTAAVALFQEIAQYTSQQSVYSSLARYRLCQFYATGKGVPQDYVQAKSWCKKSGTSFAYVVLGRFAERGLGQEKNLTEATEFYRQAALYGEPEGYLNTARLEIEMGPREGLKNAYFWYSLAAKRNVPGASDKLQETAVQLDKKEIAEQQKQIAAWIKMTAIEREKNLKKH